MKILLISTCKEKLHEMEFVKPLEDILKERYDYEVLHYSDVKECDLSVVDKVIICGTSLGDGKFLEDIEMFGWLEDFNKPVLGICAGMQVFGLIFGGEIRGKREIGYFKEKMIGGFLGLKEDFNGGEYEVWHLHNNWVDFNDDWEIFMKSGDMEQIPEAVKHKKKELYGVLFHPEVRQKEMIKKFVDSKINVQK